MNEAISQAGLLPHLRRLLFHPDAGVAARACNLIGNMCRHSSERGGTVCEIIALE